MSLVIYNTQTRQKEPFTTLEDGKVKMYCCGVTVYDLCHLGHARSSIAWDIIRRYLTWRGYDVRYVQNFTDIDDKILNRARKENSSMEEVSEKYIETFFEDMRRLNIKDADEYPRATEHVEQICDLIQALVDKGMAYASGGDVYYAVQKFPGYGKLSGRTEGQMQSGASGRVSAEGEGEPKKRNPFDFALWKGVKPGEPFWESPWGKGRPGWHIECSAMIRSRLGESIDIHGGGGDLVFPHHENEIAQSEGATGKPLAQYWAHNGMVRVNGEKMSKSLGNFTTIRDLLETIEPMVVRLFILQAQYRKPLDFTDEAIASATSGWQTFSEGLTFGDRFGDKLGWASDAPLETLPEIADKFREAMDDDFNTSAAMAVLFEIAKDLRRCGNLLVHDQPLDMDATALQKQWATLVTLADVLGLEAVVEESGADGGLSDADIEAAIANRKQARADRDFAAADRIRDDLKAAGVTLIDKPDGTVFVRE
ncbi:MAG: cysteine--tRNA ligase [Geitlerinemataceae cyanobacterium]